MGFGRLRNNVEEEDCYRGNIEILYPQGRFFDGKTRLWLTDSAMWRDVWRMEGLEPHPDSSVNPAMILIYLVLEPWVVNMLEI